MTLTDNTPSAGYMAWAGLSMQYEGVNYGIADGNTNRTYAWWAQENPNVLQTSDTYPSLGTADCIVFLNRAGVGTIVPGTTTVPGDLIVPGTITATALDVNSVTAAILNTSNINAVDGSINFLLSKEALAAYIRFSAAAGIEIGRNGGRFKNIISDSGSIIYRDGLATTQVTDLGFIGDIIKATGRYLVGDGATIEYSSGEGLSIALL